MPQGQRIKYALPIVLYFDANIFFQLRQRFCQVFPVLQSSPPARRKLVLQNFQGTSF